MPTSLQALWIGLGVSALVSYPIYRLLLLTKSRQIVDPHAPETHQAKQGTPTMGGLVIAVGFLATMVYFLLNRSVIELERFGNDEPFGFEFLQVASVLYLGFALIGFIDDFVVPRLVKGKRGLGWRQKIVMELGVAYLAGAMTFGPTEWARIGIFAFIVLFFANAYNFSDGLDGLSGTLLLGLAGGFLALGGGFDNTSAGAVVPAALIGTVIPFLFLNAPPAKAFMGDVGSLPIGAVLGLLATSFIVDVPTASLYHTDYLLPLLVLSFLMIAELVPVPLQVAYYKMTKGKRLFPMTPIHHAFEKKGWPESRVVWAFALTQALLSVLAYTLVVIR